MGFAAEYELLRAARWRGYSWQAFDQLDSDSQALVVAEYRIEMRYAAVDYQANLTKADRGNSRTHPRRGRRG